MDKYSELIESIDNYIYKNFTAVDEYQKKVYESMTYSLFSGGKRVRPILGILTYKALSGSDDYEEILPFAVAVELIHTYSLIHDDLPAMDDDDIRRGKPTNHRVYSEAIAILAGDGLLNMSAEVLSKEIETYDDLAKVKKAIKAMKYIFTASGVHDLIGGQVIDIEYNDDMNYDICEIMYKLKTAALIRASVVSAGIIAGASEEEIASLEEFANCVGIAYQIEDDILDEELDQKKEKNTMLKFKTKEELLSRIEDLTIRANNELDSLEYDTTELKEFAELLMNRGK
ncbi:geranylgeranyl diphosphate synthase, type II [Anaerosphaera aminiphila DSM 21120]|uniref:Farnesyl diphosphate synthase n=1 Tax=Anaerosphaera aminiphila DSM 21120 TaxID=1120995 RepID=A0A1M5P949_9FIRM|nr:polyprenyl synthetase family protein [Anaerosphaera aminiphila]SHG98282.1 geranylgeranyl diphosphate synthase, type II [Anaerosphaera aminiphila DSM 21120]